MNEEKITISVNEEDVQNIINCYEKDIEKLTQLQNNWNELKKYLQERTMMSVFDRQVTTNVLNKMQELEGNNE